MPKLPPLVIIVGETASGKTGLAIKLAKELNGEIINADSWAVRRELNIGTAKPTPEEQAAIKHHLIDIVDPDEEFNAMEFKKLALSAIGDIYYRNKLPIIVGGTGLYIDSLIYDFEFLPKKTIVDRDEFNNKSIDELLDIIRSLNIDTEGIDLRNKRRLIRLIETGGAKPKKKSLRANTLILGIKWPRETLKERITLRVDEMLKEGLEDEVRKLHEKYGWNDEILKGVGYRQWQLYFDGGQSLEETRQQIISATLGLAKKQRTWFKRNNSIQWIDSSVKLDHIVELITTTLDI